MKIKLIESELEIPSNIKINPKATGDEIRAVWRTKLSNLCKITDDGTVNIPSSLFLNNMGLKCIPFYFNEVSGVFDCSDNNLTSLEGSPKVVSGGFYCYNNKLYSLKDGPKEVEGWFNCRYNMVKFTEEYVRKHCKVGGYISV